MLSPFILNGFDGTQDGFPRENAMIYVGTTDDLDRTFSYDDRGRLLCGTKR